MSSASPVVAAVESQPKFRQALSLCVGALHRLANYELDPAMNRRMQELGERKEWLQEGEHGELLSLVAFSENRSLEKLEAQLALKRLGEFLPEATIQP